VEKLSERLGRIRGRPLLAVPNGISDQIAAQMLINTITASVLIKAGHNSLKTPIMPPIYVLQNAAASGVGRLLTQDALESSVSGFRAGGSPPGSAQALSHWSDRI